MIVGSKPTTRLWVIGMCLRRSAFYADAAAPDRFEPGFMRRAMTASADATPDGGSTSRWVGRSRRWAIVEHQHGTGEKIRALAVLSLATIRLPPLLEPTSSSRHNNSVTR